VHRDLLYGFGWRDSGGNQVATNAALSTQGGCISCECHQPALGVTRWCHRYSRGAAPATIAISPASPLMVAPHHRPASKFAFMAQPLPSGLDELNLESDGDIVANQNAASLQGRVPRQAEVLTIDFCGR
jgi:hypothetical protein